MTPNHYSSFSPFPIDLNEDQNQQLFSYHHHAAPEAASSSSSQPYPTFTNLTCTPEEGRYYHTESESLALPHEKEANLYSWYDHASAQFKNENHNVLRLSVSKKEGKQENKSKNISVKWTSSKMRLMKKMMMMSSDQAGTNIPEHSTHKVEDHEERSSAIRSSRDSPSNSSTSNTVMRVCADCNTTKTPLWRSGPGGPKSLCNACGIRQRKARRAAMAAAAAGAGANNGTLFAANNTPAMKNKAQYKERKIKNSHLPFKKRCKFTAGGGSSSKKLCFEDLTIILNNNSSAFQQRVFPQDEKEAAILLMALSYGLVHG